MKLILLLTLIGIELVFSKHVIVVGNSGWATHASGDKQEECAADTDTKGTGKNSYGDDIGAQCCNLDGKSGFRQNFPNGIDYNGYKGCLKGVTYADADAACKARSARLCTAAEVKANVAAGTGCEHDARHVWTSDFCGAHSIVIGDSGWATHSSGDKQEECAADDSKNGVGKNDYGDEIAVRCCSLDGQTGYSQNLPGGTDYNGYKGCLKGVTYDTAVAACKAKSYRLCTAAEIKSDVTKDSGCEHNARHVWTSDYCGKPTNPCTGVTCDAGELCENGKCVLDCSVLDIDGFLGQCSADYKLQTAAIQTNAADIDDLENQIKANDADIANNKGNIDTNTAGIGTNKAAIDTNKAGITTNAGGIATNAGAISVNKGNIDTNTQNIGTNTADVGQLKTDVGTNKNAISANDGAIKDLQDRVTKLENIVNKIHGRKTKKSGQSAVFGPDEFDGEWNYDYNDMNKPYPARSVWDSWKQIAMMAVAVLLVANIVFMTYNCCTKNKKQKERYQRVRYVDSEDVDAEANLK